MRLLDLPPASLNLRRHGDSQSKTQIAFLVIAIGFWIGAKLKDSPVMPAAVYGEWVVSFPAEWWAASIMLASAIYLSGILINGAWRWSPLLRLSGALWHIVTLTAFVIGASSAEYGDFLTISCGVFAVKHGWFAWLNAGDLCRAVRNWNE